MFPHASGWLHVTPPRPVRLVTRHHCREADLLHEAPLPGQSKFGRNSSKPRALDDLGCKRRSKTGTVVG